MLLCKVRKCRYRETHITSGHQCGSCGKYGHGRIECGNTLLCDKLKNVSENQYLSDNNMCSVNHCKYSKYHTLEGHLCSICNKYDHECFKNPLETACIEEAKIKMGNTDGKIYVLVYAGMGCVYYIKRNSVIGYLYTFFMHSDDWGQYGHSNIDEFEKFINGYTKI